MNKYFYYCRGLFGFHSRRFNVSFCGKCLPGWVSFYKEYGYEHPWQMWYKNPLFCNRSSYDEMMEQYRVWFCFMWFDFDIRVGKNKWEK